MEILTILRDWRCLVEIGLLFLLIYSVLHYLRHTRGSMVMAGLLIALLGLGVVARVLKLTVIENLFNWFSGSLLLMLMIIFQPELRRALALIGTYASQANRRRRELIGEIVLAVENMARKKCGALIVIERKIHLQALIDDSVPLDAMVNTLLLEAIFYPNAPLHDGAVIIRENRVVAARAILPLTRAENVSRSMGTRHRAALGISEESDAVTVLVSEETGAIGIAYRGMLHRDLSASTLKEMLERLVVQKDDAELQETVRKNSALLETESPMQQGEVQREREGQK